ncbi:MAG TPA: ROK family transcriptional regulator [Herpetosiphon sp.]|uniref:ROK family protein n=1 Tax=Herpetosiphon aurantiacus (strain ATCC 23779 / DSM 785 / 114-95) TaxID=316274 RepID=A9B0H5_HERA2|nr:ROK family transcriptional regulator [Herpetosiphon sp.]ABX07193.1 ROK family protein [Herpetosiphon aurantiacus DSM 785]HBW51119.1 ROK family transcriptional regulator [Herpetosiphon sp.]
MNRPSALTADLSLMRELNRALVLQLIRREGRISRADIAKHTKLSRSTVSSIINDLIDASLVTETGIGTSKGGRRPIILEFNYQANYIIGLDVSRNAVSAVITDLNARICSRRQISFNVNDGPTVGMPLIKQLISTMLTESPVGRGRISAIGVGVPGPLDFRNGRTIAPPVMPGWDNVPIREELSQTFRLPVSIDNDANLAAMAEYRWGAGQGAQNMVYLYMSSAGIGAGLIIDSHLFRGSIGSAGEVGHTTLSVENDESFGPINAGSLEALASQITVLRLAREQKLISADDDVHTLVRKAESSPEIQAILRRTAHYLGVAIASIINIFNPDRVVIGGVIPETSPLLIETIRATVARRALSIAVNNTSIVPGALGRNVAALGAAALATERLFAPPALERPATLGVHSNEVGSLAS